MLFTSLKHFCSSVWEQITVELYTFKNGADVFPYGYGSGSVELPQSQLHVKEGHAAKNGHQNVGNQESSCTQRTVSDAFFYL